jgi:hypothetical protein
MIIHTCLQGRNCFNTSFEMVYLNGLTHLILYNGSTKSKLFKHLALNGLFKQTHRFKDVNGTSPVGRQVKDLGDLIKNLPLNVLLNRLAI